MQEDKVKYINTYNALHTNRWSFTILCTGHWLLSFTIICELKSGSLDRLHPAAETILSFVFSTDTSTVASESFRLSKSRITLLLSGYGSVEQLAQELSDGVLSS